MEDAPSKKDSVCPWQALTTLMFVTKVRIWVSKQRTGLQILDKAERLARDKTLPFCLAMRGGRKPTYLTSGNICINIHKSC